MFYSILDSGVTLTAFLICMAVSLALGTLTALLFTRGSSHTGSLALSLSLLPAVVTLVIMLVNGNLGAGVAVAGTFALVRFRSTPGTAREITGLFMSVAIGLACGMGYVLMAALFFAVMALAVLLLEKLFFSNMRSHRQLKITIPEDLDFDGLFDDLLKEYTRSYELVRVRTTNMGTLYELTYDISLKGEDISREFIDAIRCRNGNLNVICGREQDREIL